MRFIRLCGYVCAYMSIYVLFLRLIFIREIYMIIFPLLCKKVLYNIVRKIFHICIIVSLPEIVHLKTCIYSIRDHEFFFCLLHPFTRSNLSSEQHLSRGAEAQREANPHIQKYAKYTAKRNTHELGQFYKAQKRRFSYSADILACQMRCRFFLILNIENIIAISLLRGIILGFEYAGETTLTVKIQFSRTSWRFEGA